jgi:hypothetical protein
VGSAAGQAGSVPGRHRWMRMADDQVKLFLIAFLIVMRSDLNFLSQILYDANAELSDTQTISVPLAKLPPEGFP